MMLIILFLILFILMAIVGGDRGALSFFTLVLNFGVGMGSVYLLGIGCNAIVILVISSFLFCQITLIYQNGYHCKTLVSLISVAIVLLVMGVLIYQICLHAHMIGMNEIDLYEEDTSYLSLVVNVDMVSIWIVSMVWAELGAIMDTSISISSALNEIAIHNPYLSKRELMGSGMQIGKDILGTTINTLSFVAIGESIMITLYYVRCSYTIQELFNSKAFFQQVSIIFFSCIGCVLIIPVTALVFVTLNKSERIKKYFEEYYKKNPVN